MFVSGKSIAVVIGISNYIGEGAGGYAALPTAKHDAEKMVRFLVDDAGFDTVYVLTDDYATKQKIDRLMTDVIPTEVGPRDRFLFYWSGHGDQRVMGGRPAGFLPLATSKSRGEFFNMVSMQDIARWDGFLDAQQALFVLDSCLSGLAGVEKKSPRNELFAQFAKPAHHLLTAGTENEIAIAGERWTGSLFTDSFILGARGQARRPTSDLVSLYSLIDFIRERVVIEKQAVNWSKSLTPQLRDLRGSDGAFFFTPPQIAGLTSNPPRTGPPSKRKAISNQPCRDHRPETRMSSSTGRATQIDPWRTVSRAFVLTVMRHHRRQTQSLRHDFLPHQTLRDHSFRHERAPTIQAPSECRELFRSIPLADPGSALSTSGSMIFCALVR